jgi:hypothetical protein
MTAFLLTVLDLAVTMASMCRPGGVRTVIAENLLLKHQLLVLRRGRRRAPNLTGSDRLLCGFASLFLSTSRIRKVALAFRPRDTLGVPSSLGTTQIPSAVFVGTMSEETRTERP